MGRISIPNALLELTSIDLEHHLQALTLDGRLFTAPIPKEKILNRVLDVGTGTGIWAIDFGVLRYVVPAAPMLTISSRRASRVASPWY